VDGAVALPVAALPAGAGVAEVSMAAGVVEDSAVEAVEGVAAVVAGGAPILR
jgi:hypothetical protein